MGCANGLALFIELITLFMTLSICLQAQSGRAAGYSQMRTFNWTAAQAPGMFVSFNFVLFPPLPLLCI